MTECRNIEDNYEQSSSGIMVEMLSLGIESKKVMTSAYKNFYCFFVKYFHHYFIFGLKKILIAFLIIIFY